MNTIHKLILFKGAGGAAWLRAFMAAQSDGFWYDFVQTDRLFQENVGPTPADDPNEVIGLAASQRLWNGQTFAAYFASQPELVTNGAFSSDTAWTKGTGWTISGGVASNNAPGGPSNLTQNLGLVAGRLYAVTFTLSVSAGNVAAYAGFSGTSSGPLAVNGTYTRYLTAGGDAQLYLQASAAFVGSVDNVSVKEVSRYPAVQATASLKPKFQTTGAAFDDLDDNLLTGYTAGVGANFMVARIVGPASEAAISAAVGASDAGSTNRFYLGNNAAGLPGAGVGALSPAFISGGSSILGREVVLGVTMDGSTVKLFCDGAEIYSAAQSGTPTTTTPLRIGAINNGGTAANFFGGSVKAVVGGRQFLDLATFNKIASQL